MRLRVFEGRNVCLTLSYRSLYAVVFEIALEVFYYVLRGRGGCGMLNGTDFSLTPLALGK